MRRCRAGLYNPALGPDKGVAVRAIHNRPKWNSEHPSLADNFGSANSLLYSYRDFELADTVLYSGTNSYETGTVFYNRVFAQKSKKVVIDPRKIVSAQNAEDLGGVHLQLKPNTDVVLLNSLMNVILSQNLHDQAYIDARVDPASFAALKAIVTQAKYTPENTEAVTGVPAAKVRKAAQLLGKPNKSSILFEKGVIWSGTQNAAVMNSYANLALLVGSVGRPGQVFGRQGGHQCAYMYDFDWGHPQAGDLRRNLWQELAEGDDRHAASSGSRTRSGCSSSRRSCASSSRRCRSWSTSTSAPPTSPPSPTSCCRRPPGASTRTRARTSSAGCASTSSSTTRPARPGPST